MKSGSLDRVVIVRKRVVDDTGPWNPVTTWLPWLTVRARIEYNSEDEKFAAGERYSERIMTIETRWFAGVDEQDRLECEGQFYDILGIRETGRRRGLEFKVEWRPDNADG